MWNALKKLVLIVGVVFFSLFLVGLLAVAVIHPNSTATTQNQLGPAGTPTSHANDNWGKEFVYMIGYPISDNLTVKQCSRGEGEYVHCRMHLAKGPPDGYTGVSGYLFTAKAVKFEGKQSVALPGAIAQVPDISGGEDADITLIVPAGADVVYLTYNN